MAVVEESVMSLLGTAASVGVARTFVDARIRKWDYFHILDSALLVASELVTNAARQTPHGEIRLQLSRDAYGVIIAVWDAAHELPQAKPMTELTLDDLDLSEEAFDDNGGWGLHIVQALSATCGVIGDPAGGKWVWARMRP
ncbi:anti-sigma regulatory factor (Ser/Thr protein kinase) [Actinomadura hallensis]|uniref:Anti-sigma regulatory factor (Ser/Thr protein kinase) n=2 Tax=Actinomadura hallensis TaxID=337895 RepID=A0A543I8V9_9ACTN|nr:anti-sigma regulatory factor (Ser/Thr protein kinase) [Actinomadura hallensis]